LLSWYERRRLGPESALCVDAENTTGALSVYESCGFRRVKRHATYRKELVLKT